MQSSSRKLFVIVLCAGSANRFKADKMFALLDGIPLFCHAVRTFLPAATQLYLVTQPDNRRQFQSALANIGIAPSAICYVDGGTTRTESVLHALQAINADDSDDALVAIHDAARPFASRKLLDILCHAAGIHGGAAPGRPVIDTMLKVDDNAIMTGVLPRENAWRISTPQVFSLNALRDAYQDIVLNTNAVFTDDTQVFFQHGGQVMLVPEDGCNLKVTYPEDLAQAEFICQQAHGIR